MHCYDECSQFSEISLRFMYWCSVEHSLSLQKEVLNLHTYNIGSKTLEARMQAQQNFRNFQPNIYEVRKFYSQYKTIFSKVLSSMILGWTEILDCILKMARTRPGNHRRQQWVPKKDRNLQRFNTLVKINGLIVDLASKVLNI